MWKASRVHDNARMKIGIVSDSHDRADMLAAAVQQAKAQGAEAIVHCGDLIGPQTVRPSLKLGLPVHLIHGNNVGDVQMLNRVAQESDGVLRYHGGDARLDLGGRRIFLVHYPDYGYAMACTGDWDLVCCGHSHMAGIDQVRNVKGGSTWLVNPGTVAALAAPATWVLGDLEAMRFELRSLSA